MILQVYRKVISWVILYPRDGYILFLVFQDLNFFLQTFRVVLSLPILRDLFFKKITFINSFQTIQLSFHRNYS